MTSLSPSPQDIANITDDRTSFTPGQLGMVTSTTAPRLIVDFWHLRFNNRNNSKLAPLTITSAASHHLRSISKLLTPSRCLTSPLVTRCSSSAVTTCLRLALRCVHRVLLLMLLLLMMLLLLPLFFHG